jgi:PAS domain S-box-containing protein
MNLLRRRRGFHHSHPDGTPITAPSNFCRFCKNIIRQTEKGRANCYKSDSVIGSPSPDGPRIHPCMSGSLWDAGTDISVGGRHIANWLIGQVRDSTQTEERICAYAREIGADETATLEAFREVPAMSRERFGQVAQVLYTIARQISTTAYQNLQQARFITEHERVEEALKKSEALLAKSQEIAHLGSWELDRFTDTLTWSDEVFRIFGFEPQEFKPDYATFLQCIHPEDCIGVDAAYLDSLRNGENRYTIEHRVLCQPTGEVRHVQERCVHVRNETGEVVRSIGMVQDITERKQTEETLAFLANFSTSANGDFFHALAEYLARALGGDFVCIDRLEADRLTASTVAVYADGQFQDNVSYTLKDTPCGAVVDRRICCFPEGVRRLFPHDEVLQELQAEGYAGITLWSYAGHPIGLIAVIGRRPYTNPGLVESVLGIVAGRAAAELERRQAEEERLALERQVQHAQKLESLGVLAGGIAHDFNNLLMAILGNADLALDALSPMSPARGNILEVEKAAKRAADLAKQMLAYSGKGHFVIEPIDAGKLVEDMAHLLEVSISKKVVLKYNFAPNLPTFDGDATQIRQIILNLITNASEAIGEKSGVIALSTGAMSCDRAYLDGTNEVFRSALSDPLPEGIYVYFEVADTGNGMDGGTLDKIFDPFFTTKFTGRGLGLSAVLGIVRGHRGTIKIYSEPRRGTTFKVLFPANELPENGTAWKPETSTELQWNGSGTVLIADDEESVCAVGTQNVDAHWIRVLTAPFGRQAVTTFREHADEIVCVLLDLTMPHMDGEETFREMRRIRPDVTVLLCSGYNEQDAMQRFSGKGVAGFIQKPYGMNELKKRLQEILQARGSVGV